MTREDLITLATTTAEAHGLDPALVCAVAHHESANWQTYAMRYEPGFYDRYISSMKNLSATEMTARATSYGLMQMMGQTAREFGFGGKFLTELCEPENGLEFGCRKLKKCIDQANGDVREALLKYNGGGNPGYPDLVLAHIEEYR